MRDAYHDEYSKPIQYIILTQIYSIIIMIQTGMHVHRELNIIQNSVSHVVYVYVHNGRIQYHM